MITPSQQTELRVRSSGVTLMELTVLMVILGVIANIAIPLIGSPETSRLRSAVELLEGDLAYAQFGSIAHSDDPRLLVFDAAAPGYSIATTSDPSTPVTNAVGGQAYTVLFGQGRAAQMPGVTIVSLDVGGDDQLGFGAYGQLDQDTDATITLGTTNYSLTITLESDTGQTTIGNLQ